MCVLGRWAEANCRSEDKSSNYNTCFHVISRKKFYFAGVQLKLLKLFGQNLLYIVSKVMCYLSNGEEECRAESPNMCVFQMLPLFYRFTLHSGPVAFILLSSLGDEKQRAQ